MAKTAKKISFRPRKAPLVHPGRLLQDLLSTHGISQSQLARHLSTSHAFINDICRGRRSISVEMAVKLGKTFQQNPKFWIDLQVEWDLDHLATINIGPLAKVA